MSLSVIFDLDGTLVDTAPDLLNAVDHVLSRDGLPPADREMIRRTISFGGRAMLRAALEAADRDASPDAIEQRLPVFLDHYKANIAEDSRPFPGLETALGRLRDHGAVMGVCTNKSEALSHALLEALALKPHFAAIIGIDTLPVCKPDPGHLLGTILRAGGDPEQAVMVGDSETDVKTAKAAGVPVIAVDFGYSDPPVASFQPDAVISHYDAFFDALSQVGRTPAPLA